MIEVNYFRLLNMMKCVTGRSSYLYRRNDGARIAVLFRFLFCNIYRENYGTFVHLLLAYFIEETHELCYY